MYIIYLLQPFVVGKQIETNLMFKWKKAIHLSVDHTFFCSFGIIDPDKDGFICKMQFHAALCKLRLFNFNHSI